MSEKLKDSDVQCPRWAAELLDQIRALEIRLGNIQSEGDWQETNFQDLYDRLGGESHAFDESLVESLFQKVAHGLLDEGLSAQTAATLINARVPSGSRLPYCNASEVAEAAKAYESK